MTSAERCDHIVEMIDRILGECPLADVSQQTKDRPDGNDVDVTTD